MGAGVSVRNIRGVLFPLASLALDRLKYSHIYTTMGLVGILLARRGGYLAPVHILPVVSITIATMGVYILNDVFDIEIDRVSHPERVLPRRAASVGHASIAAVSLMCAGTILAFSFGTAPGCFLALTMLFGILYSVPPVRLRRYAVVPNAVVGLGVFLSFLAGSTFSHATITGKLAFGALLLWAMFLCASTAKELEHIEGDMVDGIRSLPVILGFERGFRITAGIVCTAFVFPVLFIVLFGLNLAFVALVGLFFLLEIYCLRRMRDNRMSSEMHVWWERGFAPVVGVEISLILAALL